VDGPTLEALRAEIPDAAKDIRLNLEAVLQPGTLSLAQRWLVAMACAFAARNGRLAEAVVAEAQAAGVGEEIVDEARAAASLMAMNNVYYRFRHLIGKASYAERPARLRMNRLGRPSGARADLELACLAVSAINGCESCMRAHEAAVVEGGLSEDHVHDAVRIAATIKAAAVSLELDRG